MSLATKKQLEEVIGAAWLDLSRTYDSMKDDGRGKDNDDFNRGYMQAVKDAQGLLGIAVKTYRIHIPVEEGETK